MRAFKWGTPALGADGIRTTPWRECPPYSVHLVDSWVEGDTYDLEPLQDSEVPQDSGIHPAINQLEEIMPRISAGSDGLKYQGAPLVFESNPAATTILWNLLGTQMRGWLYITAFRHSPVLRCVLLLSPTTPLATEVQININSSERLISWKGQEHSLLEREGAESVGPHPIDLSMPIGTNAITPIKWCIVVDDAEQLDDHGLPYRRYTERDGDLIHSAETHELYDSERQPWEPNPTPQEIMDGARVSGMSNLNTADPGSQGSFGALWGWPDYKDNELVEACTDYLRRPCHFINTDGTEVDPKVGSIETVNRRPHGGAPGVVGGNLGYGWKLRGASAHDEQHHADMPLIEAYSRTGDMALHHCMVSQARMDLLQKRPKHGWRNDPRAEGRLAYNMLATAIALKGTAPALAANLKNQVLARANIAIDHLVALHGTSFLEIQSQHGVWTYETPASRSRRDSIIGLDIAWWSPWETAQEALGAWMLAKCVSIRGFARYAYILGRNVASSYDRSNGLIPFRRALVGNEDPDLMQVKPIEMKASSTGGATNWTAWSCAGLRVHVWAAEELGITDDPYLEHSRELIEMIDNAKLNQIDANMALQGLSESPEWWAGALR